MNIDSLQKLIHPLSDGVITALAYITGAAADNVVIREVGTSLDLKLVLGLGAGIFLIGRWMQRQTDEIKAIKFQIELLAKQIKGIKGKKERKQ
jgi:hypothetical protein